MEYGKINNTNACGKINNMNTCGWHIRSISACNHKSNTLSSSSTSKQVGREGDEGTYSPLSSFTGYAWIDRMCFSNANNSFTVWKSKCLSVSTVPKSRLNFALMASTSPFT